MKPQVESGVEPISSDVVPDEIAVTVRNLDLFYGETQALQQINLMVPEKQVTAFIGPSGCGKSTLLRCFNRLNDLIEICRIEGEIRLNGRDIYAQDIDVAELRREVGIVFQKPNPFPKSIYENVAYGLRIQGVSKRRQLDDTVEWALRGAALWDEVKDRLNSSAFWSVRWPAATSCHRPCHCSATEIHSSGRALFCASTPYQLYKVEELISELKSQYTIIMVTHNMQQAARVSDHTAFMYMGELIEFGTTDQVFTKPRLKKTEDYVTGRYG